MQITAHYTVIWNNPLLQLHGFISVTGGLSKSNLPRRHPEITNESSARLWTKAEIKLASGGTGRVQMKEVLLIKVIFYEVLQL